MWRLAKATRTLDLNSPYAYLMACRHFGDSSVVAERDGALVGFVVAYRPPLQPETTFVWQVGVDPSFQGHGIGGQMLDEVASRADPEPAAYLEATVTPSNRTSLRLFRAFGERHGAVVTEEVCFKNEHFPDGEHEEEILLRIGPLLSSQRERVISHG